MTSESATHRREPASASTARTGRRSAAEAARNERGPRPCMQLRPPFEPLGRRFARHVFALCAIAVLLPNLGFFLLARQVFLVRPLINIDYLLAGVLFPWIGATASAGLFGLLLVADFVQSVAPGYHFSPHTMLQAAGDVLALDAGYTAVIAVGILVVIAACSVVVHRVLRRLPRRVGPNVVLVVLGAAIVVGEDALQTPGPADADGPILKGDIATSALTFLYNEVRLGLGAENDAPLEPGAESASAVLFDELERGALPSRVVLVVVESLGRFRDDGLDRLLFGSVDRTRLSERYDVRRASVPFRGSTVPAELRELCRVRGSTIEPDPSRLGGLDCLPARLNDAGYRTAAVHGFMGTFFNRVEWYPALGFDEILFAPALERAAGVRSRCGLAFIGVCDHAALDWVGERLLRPEPERLFVYWLTLNAHPPLGHPDPAHTDLDCGRRPELLEHPQVCALVGFHDIVLGGLARLALDERLPPTAFVIVGDHAPALLDRDSRSLFDHGSVPSLVLWPKSIGGGGER